jgi:hypothetical protein
MSTDKIDDDTNDNEGDNEHFSLTKRATTLPTTTINTTKQKTLVMSDLRLGDCSLFVRYVGDKQQPTTGNNLLFILFMNEV